MKHPGNTTLFDHWLSIRHGRLVPDRNDLDPVAIRRVLAFTFMLEVDGSRPGERTYPVRVSGTRLDALFGREVRDERFTDLWNTRHLGELRAVMETVSDDGVPAVIGAVAAPAGAEPVGLEILLLPLRCRGRSNARLICSVAPLAMPTWFGLRAIAPLGLSTWRAIDVAALPSTVAGVPAGRVVAARSDLRRRFKVVQGGRSPSASEGDRLLQARVKPDVSAQDSVVLCFRAP